MADAIWLLNPASADWNTGTNWSPAAVPDGTANFGASNTTTLTIAANTSIGALAFAAGAPAYTFRISGPPNPSSPTFDIVGAGILNSSAAVPRFTIGGGSSLTAGTLQFHNSSSAANATLFVDQSSSLHFWDLSTADQATINIGGGFASFLAGAAFHDSSTAGDATISLGFDTSLNFDGSSSADNATISNGSQISFSGSSTAGSATITTFNLGGNGRVDFNDDASAGSATLTTNDGNVAFHDNSNAGQARLVNAAPMFSQVIVDFSDTSGVGGLHQLTAGSIEGNGFFRLGSNALSVGSNNLSTDVTGVISDGGAAGGTGAALTKVGSGTLTLSGANTYTGPTTVSAGTLLVNGSITSATTVDSAAALGGSGTTGAVTVASGGTLSPGAAVGTLSTQALSLSAGATLKIELGGTGAGQFDQVNVTGTVSLGGAALDTSLLGSFDHQAAIGASFVIVANDGTDAVSGTFAGLADGATFLIGGSLFSITYHGGTNNNDVVLTSLNGGGTDTATFAFRLVDATVTYSGNQTIIDTASSHTVLTGVEVFAFADGVVNNNDADPLVDDLFYYSHYHDVWTAHADADQHYHQFGWHEGRDPSAFFSTSLYLAAYRDVAAAGVDPLVHFDQTGWREGRVPSTTFDPAKYLAANPDVAAAHVDPLAHFLRFGAQEGRQPFAGTVIAANGFDYVYYLQHNPDVAAAGVDPFQHFQTFGWKEGRNPNALFDTSGYLVTYTDVKNAGVNPLDHYHDFGWHEGRDPSVNFDTTDYLGHYPDVAAAQTDPLVHFLRFGAFEGRSAFPDGVWG